MLGAIIGDIVGSVYEFNNIKTKDFPLFRDDCFFTDDTVMTCAVAEAIMNGGERDDFIDAKSLYSRAGYHITPYIYSDDNDKELLTVLVDDMHRDCLLNQPKIFLTFMLHEYAHYLNGDIYGKEGMTNAGIKDERMQCIIEGRVMEQEKKADAFAIKHVGKNTFMRAMDYMIRKRRERGDAAMELAIREFELRKKAAQALK